MGTIAKISVSLDSDALAWAKQRARRENMSLSAVVAEALLKQRRADALDELIADIGGDDITEAEQQALLEELGWTGKRVKAPRKNSRRRS